MPAHPVTLLIDPVPPSETLCWGDVVKWAGRQGEQLDRIVADRSAAVAAVDSVTVSRDGYVFAARLGTKVVPELFFAPPAPQMAAEVDGVVGLAFSAEALSQVGLTFPPPDAVTVSKDGR